MCNQHNARAWRIVIVYGSRLNATDTPDIITDSYECALTLAIDYARRRLWNEDRIDVRLIKDAAHV